MPESRTRSVHALNSFPSSVECAWNGVPTTSTRGCPTFRAFTVALTGNFATVSPAVTLISPSSSPARAVSMATSTVMQLKSFPGPNCPGASRVLSTVTNFGASTFTLGFGSTTGANSMKLASATASVCSAPKARRSG